MENNITRKFEIPYNFDPDLIRGMQIIKLLPSQIDCIYTAPYLQDYQSIDRNKNKEWSEMTREEYTYHMAHINDVYPGKLQLLLQQTDNSILMDAKTLQFYIDLGFTNFCCGTYEQAKIIKEINPSFKVVGSIAMHINIEDLYKKYEYIKIFDSFVLDFSYTKDIQKIKMLPSYYEYILLTNSLCNNKCDGTHHWFLPPDELNHCPGLINSVGFNKSCLIRPMDLKYFDPYIGVYKLQDRGWPTHMILKDIILYTTDYSVYPGIIYDEDIYEVNTYKK